MKKFFFILTGIFLALAVSSTAFAGDEERIDLNQQPSQKTESAINGEQTVTDLSVALNANPGVEVGSSMPLTVSAGGRMTLVSGQSIVLKPGTRIEAGGYLKASIGGQEKLQRDHPDYSNTIRTKAKFQKVETPVIIQSAASVSPFSRKTSSAINQNDRGDENLVAQVVRASGISPEPTRKITDGLVQNIAYRTETISFRLTRKTNLVNIKGETIQVLRL